MNKNFVSIVLLLVINLLDLKASTYKWSTSTDKKTAYVNEAILLSYVCEFSDESELYTIDFNPVQENEEFRIRLLKESQVLKNSKRVNAYEYIAYVKKVGLISFDFDLVMKKTTQESINSTTKGHYDDSKSESFISSPIKLLPLSIDIKKTPSKLVGEFTLAVKQDSTELVAFEPYSLEILIEGIGNFSSIESIDFNIEGVKIFAQVPILKTKFSKAGEKGLWSQKFAFVSEKSFVIPELVIEYFDVKTATLKTLVYEGVSIKVDEDVYKQEEILDTKVKEELFFKQEYLYYLLIFLFGYLMAKIKLNIFNRHRTEEELFLKCIKKTSSLEELCFLLVSKNMKKYEELISKIESKELTSLNKAKQMMFNIRLLP